MSETIRDQALKAALSILDTSKKIAFVTFSYCANNSDKNDEQFTAKVTYAQAAKILALQEKIRLENMEYNANVSGQNPHDPSATQQTIDDLISTNTGKISLGVSKKPLFKKHINGVIINQQGKPILVTINTLYAYNQLANVDTNIANLKYLAAIIDTDEMDEAIELEENLVDKITSKLQTQFNESFARQLLGDESYKEMLTIVDKPQ